MLVEERDVKFVLGQKPESLFARLGLCDEGIGYDGASSATRIRTALGKAGRVTSASARVPLLASASMAKRSHCFLMKVVGTSKLHVDMSGEVMPRSSTREAHTAKQCLADESEAAEVLMPLDVLLQHSIFSGICQHKGSITLGLKMAGNGEEKAGRRTSPSTMDSSGAVMPACKSYSMLHST